MSTDTAPTARVTPPDEAECLNCRYPLRGLTSRACPECGRSFDPTDPWTMRTSRMLFDKRLIQPTQWRYGAIRKTLIAIAILSAGFPAPNPVPPLVLAIYWLTVALPCFQRRAARHRLIESHFLDWQLSRVDDAGIWRLRKMFSVAALVIGLQLPFLAAFAVSYPFMQHSAEYWLTESPVTANPGPGPALCGVLPVLHREATLKSLVFHLPGGTVTFSLSDDWGGSGIKPSSAPYWPSW